MNIMELTDISLPTGISEVDFYTIDPDTLSFVRFGTDIFGTNNYGKLLPLYVVTTNNLQSLTLTVNSSSNLSAKIIGNNGSIYDFQGIENNNTITISSVYANTPTRITMFFALISDEWDGADISIIWNY